MPFDRIWERDVLIGAAYDVKLRKRAQRVLKDVSPWSSTAAERMWGLVGKLGETDKLTTELVERFVNQIEDEDERDEVQRLAKKILSPPEIAPGFALGKLEDWARQEVLTQGLRSDWRPKEETGSVAGNCASRPDSTRSSTPT
jgi:hypothetical protein